MKNVSFFLLLAILISGCSSYISSSQNISNQKRNYVKVLVISRLQNEVARAVMERQVSQQLVAKGVPALASFDSPFDIPIETQPAPEELEILRNKVIDAGFNGIILVQLVDTKQLKEVVPGTTYTALAPTYYGSFGTYFAYFPLVSWGPDQINETTEFGLENTFFSLEKGQTAKLEWVGRFNVEDPSDIEKAMDKYASELVNALMKESIEKGK
jgi:uncharacterized protein YceK